MTLLLRSLSNILPRNAKPYSNTGVLLRILPSSSCMFDEPVQLKLGGLTPKQHVEFRAKHKDDKGIVFKANATYQADENGGVDLTSQPSLGGTYTGVEPMGLFWSMRPEAPHNKLTKKEASSPVLIEIEASSGGEMLAKGTNERRLMADGVRRVPVTHGRVRGTLFIPPGEGPFPGIIDQYILGGILCEPRAALLASKGFVVLALAIYGYQDMPKKVDKLELEYFEEALTFLQMQPEVKKSGVGLLSISKSGELAMAMASFLPNVKATVCINASIGNVLFPLHYKDIVIPPLTVNLKRIFKTESGIVDIRDSLNDPMAEENRAAVIPIERASCSFLFIVSEDDRNWNSAYFAELACRKLKEHGKSKYEVVSYPKAGHLVEIPYMPFCPSGFHAAVGQAVAFGGEAKAHAEAQVDAWKRVQEFFRRHL